MSDDFISAGQGYPWTGKDREMRDAMDPKSSRARILQLEARVKKLEECLHDLLYGWSNTPPPHKVSWTPGFARARELLEGSEK